MFTNSLVSDDTVTASLDTVSLPPHRGLADYIPIDRHVSAPVRERPAAEAKPGLLEISPAGAFARRVLSCNGVTAEFIEASTRARSEMRFSGPVHLLVVYEQGSRHGGETTLAGLPPSKLRDVGRRFTFVPAGRAFHEWQEPRTLSKMMCIYLDPAILPLDAKLRGAERSLAPRMFFEDAGLWETVHKLAKLVAEPSAADRAYFEALGAVLMHEIIRLDQRAASAQPLVRGGLAAWQRRVVGTYIDEHLAERVPLAALAALVRLSPFHFCRAFKQSFGVPPHRYHSNRRVERAKLLLADPDFSVTEIGLDLGFSETSSFTTAFRRATGMTPTAYHRSLAAVAPKPRAVDAPDHALPQ
jgi:AraC family transcriptional regulator